MQTIDTAELQSGLEGLTLEALLERIARRFGGRVALASSLGAEDQVLTDVIAQASLPIAIFTIDTGRLPAQTHELLDATRERYGLVIEVLTPDSAELGAVLAERGSNFFRRSVEDRKLCCHVRKVLPLRRRLAGLEAWVTGLRREQSITRQDLPIVHWDEAHQLVKLNPLAGWSKDDVWQYIRQHRVPYNVLHDRGYPSIGCEPCTRAVEPGQDIRAGRWWWEQPEHRECGLHLAATGSQIHGSAP